VVLGRALGRMSHSDDEDGMSGAQLRVQFVTEHERFRVTDTSIAVPAELGRTGLSQIINHLLALPEVVPFDFLIREKQALVRSTLRRHLDDLQLSSEAVLVLEYAPALQQPDLSAESEWPDWIAAVDARLEAEPGCPVVACGAYDGSLQLSRLVKSAAGPEGGSGGVQVELIDRIQAHRGAVKGVRQFQSEQGAKYVATVGKDGLAHIFQTVYSARGDDGLQKLEDTRVATCQGHVGSVECVDAVELGEFALMGTGGWDHAVCLWKVPLAGGGAEESEARPAKSRRTGKAGAQERAALVKQEAPAALLSGHRDCVSAVCWESRSAPATLFSGSWDHSLRAWDVTRESCVMELVGNKVVTGLDHNESRRVLASAHADNMVRIWDSRTTGDSVAKLGLKSHKAWVAAVRWSPTNENLLVSASHDRTLKLWDVRSTVPLYTLSQHTAKVLAVDWTADASSIVSGGADSRLRAFAM